MSDHPILLHRALDTLYWAIPANVSLELAAELEEVRNMAAEARQPAIVACGDRVFLIPPTGGTGGYRYRLEAAEGRWTIKVKLPNRADPWGIFVEVGSRTLATLPLDSVIDGVRADLAAIGVETPPDYWSGNRIDYALDFLMPGFVLSPDAFVMHSRFLRKDHYDMLVGGNSGRVTSVTIGKMPGRQIIVYHKGHEVLCANKPWWFVLWNDTLQRSGLPLLEAAAPAPDVWRVEFRAGRGALARFGIKPWPLLLSRAGDLFAGLSDDIRMASLGEDRNRARNTDHPIWRRVRHALDEGMMSMATGSPGTHRPRGDARYRRTNHARSTSRLDRRFERSRRHGPSRHCRAFPWRGTPREALDRQGPRSLRSIFGAGANEIRSSGAPVVGTTGIRRNGLSVERRNDYTLTTRPESLRVLDVKKPASL